jgi:hypothetical protein
VADLSTSKDGGYTSRQAAYDLKKLRGKQLIDRIGSLTPLPSFCYRASSHDCPGRSSPQSHVIKPLLASCCQLKRGRKPKNATPLDEHYQQLQTDMRKLFDELGLAA